MGHSLTTAAVVNRDTRPDMWQKGTAKRWEDYEETFTPTANFTSIRVLMQQDVQENLILHQMDVKK